MNRFDEIHAVARDIASNVHADPVARNAMADDLIRLCGLMINAVGKGVAINGESALNDATDAEFPWDDGSYDPSSAERAEAEAERVADQIKAHGMYLTGERMQDAADRAVTEAVGADLERYDRPVWQHVDRRPAWANCDDCGHTRSEHDDSAGCMATDSDGDYCSCNRGPDGASRQPVGRCTALFLSGARCTKDAGHFSREEPHSIN